ncbi:5-formyltetrahydrofolate cyclo-ligase [Tsukamurella soli]|uniref:5-formyltetrahydrofolate cyclo-ligase n=1 Tax=Tsukamurella soli TaxID=644556 RepID=A0ABP8JV43_9ACTN
MSPPRPANDRAAQKCACRGRFRAARAALTDASRAAAAAELAARVVRLELGPVIAAYVPVGSEPGDDRLLAALAARARVLLPVTPRVPGPLDWADFDGGFTPGPFGLREPRGPRLGAAALRQATTVLLPALAVARTGVRLGRGAGYYDRSLVGLCGATLIAVVYDHELVDDLPAEPTDVSVDGALTPSGLVRFVGRPSESRPER